MKDIPMFILGKSVAEIAILLALVICFLWATVGAVVFLIRMTRVEKFLGAEFDPETQTKSKK